MAKRIATPKKKPDSPASPTPTKKAKSARAVKAPAASPRGSEARLPGMHVYRHEIGENLSNAPLIVDLPIADGRGEKPSAPSFVGFTAEMAEEYWQDQFAFRIISLGGDSVRVMISRIDKGSPELGWGVKLAVQVLVVDTPGA